MKKINKNEKIHDFMAILAIMNIMNSNDFYDGMRSKFFSSMN